MVTDKILLFTGKIGEKAYFLSQVSDLGNNYSKFGRGGILSDIGSKI